MKCLMQSKINGSKQAMEIDASMSTFQYPAMILGSSALLGCSTFRIIISAMENVNSRKNEIKNVRLITITNPLVLRNCSWYFFFRTETAEANRIKNITRPEAIVVIC